MNQSFMDDRDSYRYRFNYLWTASPNVLITFRAGLTRTPDRFVEFLFPRTEQRTQFGCQIGLPRIEEIGALQGFGCEAPTVPIEGFATGGGGGTIGRGGFKNRVETKIPTNIAVNWYKGSHNIKLGVDATFVPLANREGFGAGTYNFTERVSGLPGDPSTGSGWASFLLGEVDKYSVITPYDVASYQAGWAFYAQDQWRLNNKWTVTAGLRWNIFQPWYEKQDKTGTFDATIPNPGATESWGRWRSMARARGETGYTRSTIRSTGLSRRILVWPTA